MVQNKNLVKKTFPYNQNTAPKSTAMSFRNKLLNFSCHLFIAVMLLFRERDCENGCIFINELFDLLICCNTFKHCFQTFLLISNNHTDS